MKYKKKYLQKIKKKKENKWIKKIFTIIQNQINSRSNKLTNKNIRLSTHLKLWHHTKPITHILAHGVINLLHYGMFSFTYTIMPPL